MKIKDCKTEEECRFCNKKATCSILLNYNIELDLNNIVIKSQSEQIFLEVCDYHKEMILSDNPRKTLLHLLHNIEVLEI